MNELKWIIAVGNKEVDRRKTKKEAIEEVKRLRSVGKIAFVHKNDYKWLDK